MSDQIFMIFSLCTFILMMIIQLLKAKSFSVKTDEALRDKRSFIKRIFEFNLALDKYNEEAKYGLFELKERRISREEELYGISKELSVKIDEKETNKDQITRDIKKLMEIPGVGKTLAGRLIQIFESIEEIKKLNVKNLIKIPSVGDQLARKIIKHLAESVVEKQDKEK